MSGAPHIYPALSAITRALARKGITKARTNSDSGYAYRGIDDIYAALAPLLSRHKVCMLPRMVDRGGEVHRAGNGQLLFATWVRAAFDFVSCVDASRHSVEVYGEAIDGGDKGTAKAMSVAFKYAAVQSFCIPVGDEDADARTPPAIRSADQPPVEGWTAWTADLKLVVAACETHEALDRMQAIHRDRLRALSKAESELYTSLGDAIGERRASLRLPRLEVA